MKMNNPEFLSNMIHYVETFQDHTIIIDGKDHNVVDLLKFVIKLKEEYEKE